MAYLEGDEAFTLVLDRLIDAEKRAADKNMEANSLAATERNLTRELENEKAANSNLKAKTAADAPKLLKLHEAARVIVDVLRRHELPAPGEVEALRLAIAGAAEACGADDIPF